jgi:hypothetical protein
MCRSQAHFLGARCFFLQEDADERGKRMAREKFQVRIGLQLQLNTRVAARCAVAAALACCPGQPPSSHLLHALVCCHTAAGTTDYHTFVLLAFVAEHPPTQAIRTAYDVLSHPEKRHAYDRGEVVDM